ncbi:unnamed protein product [Clavelina lepadiformis]|uniref:NADP-dependent oxidoreductase domain-containing protein n=1 Tax=Clavelina lepadiformis TaxID=159417 RepID=A0ABP0GU88_CLALP
MIPQITLNNGAKMPVLALGTSKMCGDEVHRAIAAAIDSGYRHIDCAHVYGNEKQVGEAIQAKIKDGSVTREELFITGKLWSSFSRPEHMEKAIDRSLRNMQMDYFDLYLIHWPIPLVHCGFEKLIPLDQTGKKIIDKDANYVKTWKAMKHFVESGKARAVGVSNFNSIQISRLLRESDVIPAVNQIEVHPYLNQEKLIAFCHDREVVVTGYCCMGSRDRPSVLASGINLLEDDVMVRLAAKYGKSPAQIALRFGVQRGIGVVAKSATPSRILENTKIFDFVLSEEDMTALMALDRDFKIMSYFSTDNPAYDPYRANYREDDEGFPVL